MIGQMIEAEPELRKKLIQVVNQLIDMSVVIGQTVLGEGGYATVFEGNFRGTKVAIKQVKYANVIYDAREATALKTLNNSNVVQLLHSLDHQGSR